MKHTKRSPEFLMELRRLIEKLEAKTIDDDERARIAEILRKNTTDAKHIVEAADDERIFPLRESDPLFSDTVEFWSLTAGHGDTHEEAKIQDAYDLSQIVRQQSEGTDHEQKRAPNPLAEKCADQ